MKNRSLRLAASAVFVWAALGWAPARAEEPSAAAVANARAIILDSGISKSFDALVPQMLGMLERNITATRPEIKDKLHATLLQLQPEFMKGEEAVINAASQNLARRLTPNELADVAAFFQSPSGKKYVEATPAMLGDIVVALDEWRQKLSTDMMTRVREEMKKQGVDL